MKNLSIRALVALVAVGACAQAQRAAFRAVTQSRYFAAFDPPVQAWLAESLLELVARFTAPATPRWWCRAGCGVGIERG